MYSAFFSSMILMEANICSWWWLYFLTRHAPNIRSDPTYISLPLLRFFSRFWIPPSSGSSFCLQQHCILKCRCFFLLDLYFRKRLLSLHWYCAPPPSSSDPPSPSLPVLMSVLCCSIFCLQPPDSYLLFFMLDYGRLPSWTSFMDSVCTQMDMEWIYKYLKI